MANVFKLRGGTGLGFVTFAHQVAHQVGLVSGAGFHDMMSALRAFGQLVTASRVKTERDNEVMIRRQEHEVIGCCVP